MTRFGRGPHQDLVLGRIVLAPVWSFFGLFGVFWGFRAAGSLLHTRPGLIAPFTVVVAQF